MPLSYPDKLQPPDRRRLVEALLECACLQTPADRDQVHADLPDTIRNKVNRRPNAKQDVDEFVRASLQFPAGLKPLLDIVAFYEDETANSWTRVLQVLQDIHAAQQLDDVGRQLAGSGASPANVQAIARQQLEAVKHQHGQTGDPRAQQSYLDEKMHRINFTKLRDFLNYGEQHYTHDGFAALCVLQQSEMLGGRWDSTTSGRG